MTIALLKYANKALTVVTTGFRVAATTSSVVDSVGRIGLDLLEMESGRGSKKRQVFHVAMDLALLGVDFSEAALSIKALKHHCCPPKKSKEPYYARFLESHPPKRDWEKEDSNARYEALCQNRDAIRSFLTIEKPISMVPSVFVFVMRYPQGGKRPEEFYGRLAQTITGLAQMLLLNHSNPSTEIDYSQDLSWYFSSNPVVNGVVLAISRDKLRVWRENHMLKLVSRLRETGRLPGCASSRSARPRRGQSRLARC